MPVDNAMYDRLAGTWWEPDAWLNLLKTALNPVRVGYLRRAAEAEGVPFGARALDVGCGGGLMAEDVARLGFRVTGVDPSEPSLETARRHAADQGLEIEYVRAKGEQLPFEDASFDLAYCCDVLEHVDDVDVVLAETHRVLRPGGLFVFDTINRTPLSKFVMIKLFQDWDSTRLVEPNLHDHAKFIRPRELAKSLRGAGLEPKGFEGFGPDASPPKLISLMRKRRRGEMTMEEFARRAVMVPQRSKAVSYAGHAVPA